MRSEKLGSRVALGGLITAFYLLLAPCQALSAPGQTTVFPIPSAHAEPFGITTGPDGALWFTEGRAGKIGRITTTGQITEFPLSSPDDRPNGITSGPDGALWFTESAAGKIGRITTTGQITEFPVPHEHFPRNSIATGPDGALWFTESGESNGPAQIGRITTAGQVTEFPLPSGDEPRRITRGPGGDLWFTASPPLGSGDEAGEIGRISPSGKVSEFPLPPFTNGSSGTGTPIGLAPGPEGALWFTVSVSTFEEATEGKVGRIAPDGQISEFRPLNGSRGFYPRDIVAGPDDHLWISAQGGSEDWGPSGAGIAAVSAAGNFTDFNGVGGTLSALTLGPDGNLWYTASDPPEGRDEEGGPGAIVRFTTGLKEANISTARPVASGPWTKLRLSCFSPDVECQGKVRLRNALATVAQREFRLASGSTHKFSLRLSRKAQNYLSRERWMNVKVTISVEEGEGEFRELVLRKGRVSRKPIR